MTDFIEIGLEDQKWFPWLDEFWTVLLGEALTAQGAHMLIIALPDIITDIMFAVEVLQSRDTYSSLNTHEFYGVVAGLFLSALLGLLMLYWRHKIVKTQSIRDRDVKIDAKKRKKEDEENNIFNEEKEEKYFHWLKVSTENILNSITDAEERKKYEERMREYHITYAKKIEDGRESGIATHRYKLPNRIHRDPFEGLEDDLLASAIIPLFLVPLVEDGPQMLLNLYLHHVTGLNMSPVALVSFSFGLINNIIASSLITRFAYAFSCLTRFPGFLFAFVIFVLSFTWSIAGLILYFGYEWGK